MNIFEQASREKLRFDSVRGELTVENLWDLSLESKTGFDLDTIAKSVKRKLNEMAEESFVKTSTSVQQQLHELRLEILKHVINSKLEARKAAQDAATKKAEKQKLLEVLSKKKDQALENLSLEEIEKRISEL